jgi:methylated-DNA-[protein]-cysteine S-methyltransferase
MRYARHDTPIGPLLLLASDAGLAGVYTEQHRRGPTVQSSWREDDAPFTEAKRQLDEYFAGERTRFDLALAPVGTPFQLRVWEALRRITFGETWSYGRLAAEIGQSKASRAVGAANGRNPLSIVVPCHRVIGTDGSLTGYAGGESRKRWLLLFEAAREGSPPTGVSSPDATRQPAKVLRAR